MTSNKERGLQTTPEQTLAEGTWPGNLVTPAVDIFENSATITLLADMPGVAADDLKIDLDDDVLTITGRVRPPESNKETDVFREFRFGTFQRKFNLSESIDQERIEANLTNGVLRLQLPKVERAKARKIQVKRT